MVTPQRPRTTNPRSPARGSSAARPNRGGGTKRRDREVLDTAAEVFYRQGYADASVQDVADALGILKGSLYHYIDSKEDLLFAILEEVHADVDALFATATGRTGVAPLERLVDYVRNQVEYNARNVTKIAVYYQDGDKLSPPRRQEIRSRRRAHEKYVAGLLHEAQERGEAPPDLDVPLATASIFATMIWPYTWYRPGGGVSARRLSDFVAGFVRRGVGGGAQAS